MGIRIIIGRANCDKSAYIYQEITDRINKGRGRMYLIVPEQFTLGAERELMDYGHLPGLLGADVLSIKRLSHKILDENGGEAAAFIDDHGRRMLLAKSIRQVAGKMNVYKKSANRIGFLEHVASLIEELKQEGIQPDELLAASEDNDGRLLSQKLKDIYQIYAAFEAFLGDSCMDSEDRMNRVIRQIPESRFLEKSLIWMDGFHTFSTQDFNLICALARKVNTLTITLTCEINRGTSDAMAFAVPQATLSRIAEMANENNIKCQVIDLNQKPGKVKNALNHLERNLFAIKPDIWTEQPNGIKLSKWATRWEEVEAAARQIIALVRDCGMRYRDIVVLTGDINVCGSTIRKVFAEFHIPCFIDEVHGITENALPEAVLSVLSILRSGYAYEDMFAFVKTGYAPITADESEDLENYVIEFGIHGKMWESPFMTQSTDVAIDLERLNQLRVILTTPLKKLREAMALAPSFAEKTRCLVNFLIDAEIDKKVDARVEAFKAIGDFDSAAQCSQIWNILMEVFDQVATVMGESQADLAEYIEILRSGFASYTVGIIPSRQDVVTIADPLRSRSHSMKAMVVLGLNEGLLPRSNTAFGLLSDQERSLLKEKNLDLKKDNRFTQSQEDYLIYSLFSRPSHLLSLSYSAVDEEGATLAPSPLIGRLKAIFPNLEIQINMDTIDYVSNAAGTFDLYSDYCRESHHGEIEMDEDNQIWQSVGRWYSSSKEWQMPMEILNSALHYTGVDDKLHSEKAASVFEMPLIASVSRLERYRQCPFAHFVQYGLKPQPRPTYTVEVPDIGVLLHEMVDAVYRMTEGTGRPLTELSNAERDALVDKIFDDLLPNVRHQVFASTGAYQYLGRKLRRVSKKTIKVLVQQMQQGAFDFTFSERRFAEVIDLPHFGQNLRLRGIIDRIDLYQKEGDTFVKVIDYKSGNRKMDLAEIYYGLSLQLVVYMDAAMAMLGGEEIIPGGTFYFHIDDPVTEVGSFDEATLTKALNDHFMLNGIYLDDSRFIEAMDQESNGKTSDIIHLKASNFRLTRGEFDALIKYVRRVMVDMGEAILGGDIAVRPYKKNQKNACEHCDYGGVCQFDLSLRHACYEVLKDTITRDAFMEKIAEGEKEHAVD